MCRTGEYRERGIWRLDGYQAEYVVDRQRYAVGVPADAAAVGVLIEPLSIVEKAIEMATYVQKARVPDAGPEWLTNCRCLVAGLGPIGLLGAMVLRLRGAKVHGLDIVDTTSVRARWLTALGGEYIDGRDVPPKEIRDAVDAQRGILFGQVSALGVDALRAAWTDGDSWLETVRSLLERNRWRVAELLPDGIGYVMPEATYLAWLDCRSLGLGDDPSAFFERAGKVLLCRGSEFGPEGNGFARLNFATSLPVLDELLRRIRAALGCR